MAGPIPIRSNEPRWWVSVNGQSEGPHGQAYIQACLNAGHFSANTLLCMEGDQRWMPVNSWPQFAYEAAPAAYGHPPPPVFQPSTTSPLNFGNQKESRSRPRQLPSSLKTAITYAKVVSPLIFMAGLVSTFRGGALDPLALTMHVVLTAIDALARTLMLLGALETEKNVDQGLKLMKAGCWIAAVSGVIGIGLVMIVVLAVVSLPEFQDIDQQGGMPAPQQGQEGVAVFDCFLGIVGIGELIYVITVLFSIASFRERRSGGSNYGV